MTKKVAVVGAGFSGVMSVYHLLNQLPDNKSDQNADLTEIIIFDKAEHVGGIAYGRHTDPVMVMNIPIDQMSAFESDPLHLFNWLQDLENSNVPEALRSLYKGKLGKKDFCPRILYGYYLNAILEEAKKLAEKKGVKLVFENETEVQKIDEQSATNTVITHKKLDKGEKPAETQVSSFHKVILATGNDLPFKQPRFISETAANDPNYIKSVWSRDIAAKIRAIPLDKDICVIGTALSAMDVVLIRYDMIQQAIAQGKKPSGKLILLSRHGLLHEPYSKGESFTEVEQLRNNTKSIIESFNPNATFDELKQEFTNLIEHSNKNAYRFRKLVEKGGYADFRNLLTARYSKLNPEEVKALLNDILAASHLETLATGMPYGTGRKIAKLGSLGLLEVIQPIEFGKLTSINSVDKEGEQFVIRLEDGRNNECNIVINATGTNHEYSKTKVLPYPSLYDAQKIKTHQAGFDLATDEKGRMQDANGQASDSLYCVGPMRSAADAVSRKPILSTNRSIVRLRQQVPETISAIVSSVMPAVDAANIPQQVTNENKPSFVRRKPRAETQFYSFYNTEPCRTDGDLSVAADIFCNKGNKIIAAEINLDAKFSYLQSATVKAEKIEVTTEKMSIKDTKIVVGSMETNAKKAKLVNARLNFRNNNVGKNQQGKRTVQLWKHEGEISKWQDVSIVVEGLDLGVWGSHNLSRTHTLDDGQKHIVEVRGKYLHIDDENAKQENRLKTSLNFYKKGDILNASVWLKSIDLQKLIVEDKKNPTNSLEDVYLQLEQNIERKMAVIKNKTSKTKKLVCYKACLKVDNDAPKKVDQIPNIKDTVKYLTRNGTFSQRIDRPAAPHPAAAQVVALRRNILSRSC